MLHKHVKSTDRQTDRQVDGQTVSFQVCVCTGVFPGVCVLAGVYPDVSKVDGVVCVQVCVQVCYLGHLWSEVDVSEVDGVGLQVVEQLTEQHSVSQCQHKVTHLRPLPGHPVALRQHPTRDQPRPALTPQLHVTLGTAPRQPHYSVTTAFFER